MVENSISFSQGQKCKRADKNQQFLNESYSITEGWNKKNGHAGKQNYADDWLHTTHSSTVY